MQNELAKSSASNMSEAEDSAVVQEQILTTKMMEIQAQLEKSNTKNESLRIEKQDLEQ